MEPVNTIERVRCEIGLTRAQMLSVLMSRPGRATLFTYDDDRVDAIFLDQAKALLELYRQWKEELFEAIEDLEMADDDVITPTVAARLLGVSEFHLVQLRIRGVVAAVKTSQRNWGYTKQALIDLVNRNSEVVKPGSIKSRGPLASGFIAYLARRGETANNFQKIPA